MHTFPNLFLTEISVQSLVLTRCSSAENARDGKGKEKATRDEIEGEDEPTRSQGRRHD